MNTGIGQDAKAGDREVLSRAQDGDRSAFEMLVERHRDIVYSLGRNLGLPETDAAEIVQETFLSTYQQLKEFRGEAELRTWVLRFAAKKALIRIRHHRSEQAGQAALQLSELDERSNLAKARATDWSSGADEKILDPELRRAIEEATDRLPYRHRDVFLFKDLAELSYEQIANICDDSVAAVKSRLHQARLSLRDAIDHFYRNELVPRIGIGLGPQPVR